MAGQRNPSRRCIIFVGLTILVVFLGAVTGVCVEVIHWTSAQQQLRVIVPPQAASPNPPQLSGPFVEGCVLLPDGRPAAGTAVALVTLNQTIRVWNGQIVGDNPDHSVAAADGRFRLRRRSDEFVVLAVGPEGYGKADQDQLAQSAQMRLIPWGRITGTVLTGQKPAGGQWINVSNDYWQTQPPDPVVQFQTGGTIDSNGGFAVNYVTAGTVTICRFPPGQRQTADSQVTVIAGQTAIRTIRAYRTVIGNVQPPNDFPARLKNKIVAMIFARTTGPAQTIPDSLKSAPAALRQKWWNDWSATSDGQAYASDPWIQHHQTIAADSSFTVKSGLPAGRYRLRSYVIDGEKFAATGEEEFVVPDIVGDTFDQPLMIPTLTLTMGGQFH
jgi:hypothetical protein